MICEKIGKPALAQAPLHAVLMVLAMSCLATAALASELKVHVQDGKKAALADTVISLHAAPGATLVQPGRAIMDQRNSQFTPGVLPITLGSSVTFPNSDNIRHQVYSFSPAKTFDLPLYAGTPAAPLRFDKAGVVAIGCNIHDWMIGWIVVLDTPYFGKTDASGNVAIPLPPGRYAMRAWHPRMAAAVADEDIVVAEGAATIRTVQIKLAPPPPPRRGNRRLMPMPAAAGSGG